MISHFSQSDTELSNQADIAGAEYFSTLTVMQKKYLILTIENTNFLIFCLRMNRITEEFVSMKSELIFINIKLKMFFI